MPNSFRLETVGSSADRKEKIAVVLDALVRRITVLFPRLQAQLKQNIDIDAETQGIKANSVSFSLLRARQNIDITAERRGIEVKSVSFPLLRALLKRDVHIDVAKAQSIKAESAVISHLQTDLTLH